MKKISNLLLVSALFSFTLISCKKDENKDYYTGGKAPVLSANKSSIGLSFATKDNEAVTLNWTNPDYKFTTGVSSQDVSYIIEIDTAGANFTNPNKQSIGISKDLSKTFTQSELNTILYSQMKLVAGMPHNIELRITSTLVNNSVPLTSNVLKFTVTPFAIPPKVEPPTNGTLWLTGDATSSGYANPLGTPYNVTQKFTKISNTLYELTLAMNGGGAYKLIQIQGDWSTQYHMLTGGTWDSGDFEKKDSDPGFPGPPAAGNYKITVDFQAGRYTVTKL
jgi:hypothetical protein